MDASKKATSSALSVDGAPDHTYGSRTLDEDKDVWQHNAWYVEAAYRDHVVPPPEHESMVAELLAKQAENPVPDDDAARYHADPASYWDAFYARHENRFFKDRRWLHLEFPELVAATKSDAGEQTVIEVGCGAGNTVFPLLAINENPKLKLVACDYAPQAVQVVKESELYKSPPCGKCEAYTWDLSSTSLPPGIEPGSVDIVVLIFVFSALHPDEWKQAAENVYQALKPGGMVLFRDYGRHDLPQLRFRKNRMLSDNFYVRGDGTRVYFFTPDELYSVFCAAKRGDEAVEGEHRFSTQQMAVDRRLLLNRKERKQMYRVWMQVKFKKV
ncbi:tRNA(Thr) (cytosine(32)-N(3))-methyltransferase [Malassezia cuniculi]|uniref:tRNA N(3)-methylcytidine methyltransferase n=1 Tax=Malassezia cuniculi TaxID=948313 RepID=A0AAF0ES46_9BASI|nr:tRNA(Thr) (cytosine(32)-N(3))-methyltransferase [Malassezia cuniculi]